MCGLASLTTRFVSWMSDLSLVEMSWGLRQAPTDRAGAHVLNTQELQALISWHFPNLVCISRLLFSQFSERHNVQTLDVGWLSDAHGSISCLRDFSTAEFPLSHFSVSGSETLLQLRDACSQTSSHPAALSSTATPMIPWYPCCGLLSTKTHSSYTDVSKPSPLAEARK